MEILSLMRTLGGLGMVLGLLAGALWVVRRYNIQLPGRIGSGGGRRLELVERLTVDTKRSVALIRRDGCEHLIFIDPTGAVIVETGIPCTVPVRIEGPAGNGTLASSGAASANPDGPFHDVLARVLAKSRRMLTNVGTSTPAGEGSPR